MANDTVTTLGNALKQYYKSGKLVLMAYKDHPTWALMNKKKDFYGRNIPIIPWYAGTAGQSRVFSTAQSNASPESVAEFAVTRTKDYAVKDIELEALFASENDAGAFLKLGTDAVENTNRQVSRNIAHAIFVNHGAARGVVSSISTVTLTLTNAADAVFFEVGMKLKQSTTDGTTGSVGGAAAVTITGVNRREGKLIAAAWTGFSAADFLFREGDFGLGLRGFASWLPLTAPTTGDSFLGVDRSVDSRLYGQAVDCTTTGFGMVEGIEELDAVIAREGGRPEYLALNPHDMRLLKTQLGSQIEFDTAKSPDAPITFKTLVLPSVGGAGQIKIYPDADCPKNRGIMWDSETWVFHSLGDAPRGLVATGTSIGQNFLSKATEDAVQCRVGMYGNMYCYSPNGNGIIKFA